ncbi:CaiB/BaiF CoA transferase family protein [Thermodesulfobacteriota bacterium]
MQGKALEGVKIADFTWIATGPITVNYLAQYGAVDVKVDSATRPGGSMALSTTKSASSATKYTIAINMSNPKGVEVAKRLVAWADIVAENFRAGQMEKWGMGYEDLKKINPSIIMFRSSTQGQTGPNARTAAFGITLQSLTGFTGLTGWPDRDPSPPWDAYTDTIVAPLGAAMIIAALDYRARTGKGQYLDLSQWEASLRYLSPAILDYFVNGRCATRAGNTCAYAAPHGVYRCAGDDRWCAIAVFSNEEWKAFCEAISEPRWTEDPKFATMVGRKENETELNRLIEEWSINYTAEEVMQLLQDHGVSAGVAENAADIFQDPQIKERGLLEEIVDEELGPFSTEHLAFKLSKSPAPINVPSPRVGQHTEYVCREFLGMSDEEFVDLINAGALE